MNDASGTFKSRSLLPLRMATRTLVLFAVVTLVALTVVAPTASARDVPEVPPVCGEIYNWCDEILQPVRDLQQTVCEDVLEGRCP